jgi:uncharacterized protein (DUF2345 family)
MIATHGMTLNQVLKKLGYKATKNTKLAAGGKYILKDGKVIFVGTAGEVWKWLRERGDIE